MAPSQSGGLFQRGRYGTVFFGAELHGALHGSLVQLAAEAKQAMHASDTVDLQHKQGFVPEDMGPDQFGAFIQSEVRRWSEVLSAANIKEN